MSSTATAPSSRPWPALWALLVGFFMIPADTRTNTGRIWVYQAAVRQVTVS